MNAADRDRLDRLHRMQCIACEIDGYPTSCGPIEAHHLVDRGYRKHSGGHQSTIPLGAWHHRAEPFTDWSKARMELVYGPSLASNKRAFIARYGTERELLAKVDERLPCPDCHGRGKSLVTAEGRTIYYCGCDS